MKATKENLTGKVVRIENTGLKRAWLTLLTVNDEPLENVSRVQLDLDLENGSGFVKATLTLAHSEDVVLENPVVQIDVIASEFEEE